MSTLPDPVTLPDLAGEDEAPGQSHDAEVNKFLLPDSPIVPLGQAIGGSRIVFMDRNNVLQERDTRLSNNDFVLHCGGQDWLWENFPRYAKQSEKDKKDQVPRVQVGFDHGEAGGELAEACFTKGIFNPEGRVFGRGAHRPRHDEDLLLLHCGNRLLLANVPDNRGRRLKKLQGAKAGEYQGAFYPGGPPLPLPDLGSAATCEESRELMDLFGEWSWIAPELARLLLLGWVGQMYICGALNWRAHIWLTGSTAAGKSHLQKLLRALASDWAITTEDASPAYIRQKLGLDRLAVLIDEAEADDDAERQQAMLTLARKGSSGGSIGRGGSDHKAQDFTIHSAFVLSSIIHSIKVGQDHNRFAILDMRPIPSDKADLRLDLPHLRGLGRRLHRRMLDQWHRFDATLDYYKGEIHAAGYAGRWRDTFGTLLACADLLLFDYAPAQRLDPLNPENFDREEGEDVGGAAWVRLIEPLMMRGTEEARTDTERCIQYLLSALVPGAGGQPPESVARWLRKAVEPGLKWDGEREIICIDEAARDRLKTYGLRVFLPKELAPDEKGRARYGVNELGHGEQAWRDGYLAVAGGGHKGLQELFRGAPGDFASGQWVQSLAKAEGAIRTKMRFEKVGSPEYVVALPLSMFMPGEAG
tara:strand:+ start:1062 stop:2990 length:1929 start_codon:yes stop_codon:yes gene_type:complete